MNLFPDLKKRGVGDPLERVYTPDRLAAFCLDLLQWHGVDTVLEPHAGGGAFLRAMERQVGVRSGCDWVMACSS